MFFPFYRSLSPQGAQPGVDRVQVKDLGVEPLAGPLQVLLAFGVIGILDGFQEIRVAPDATHVLRRAGAPAFDTCRVSLVRLRRQDLFHQQGMLPTVAKVVFVEELKPLACDDPVQL